MRDSPNPIHISSAFTNDDIVFARHRRLRPRGKNLGSCPLCEEGKNFPSIIPNKYSSLSDTQSSNNSPVAKGFCGVIIYDQKHNQELLCNKEMGAEVLRVILLRAKNDFKRYPFIIAFENKGSYFGASLPHPHGQYWAMAWIPRQQKTYWQNFERNQCLLCQSKSQDLVIYENSLAIAEVSPYPLLPYEVIISLKKVHKFPKDNDLYSLNEALQGVYQAIENSLGGPFENSLIAWHLPPQGDFKKYHFHISIHVPHESLSTTKVFGGIEFLTRTYVNSFPPEEVATRLRMHINAQR